ncbi:hypothetical protein VNO77_20084 [Canavalia gladiata]|uniref:Uncharacterized protein n=1 Tax=Canavalia gladiata TaxID=3824 RepID=A0AAN9LNX5_CANGL
MVTNSSGTYRIKENCTNLSKKMMSLAWRFRTHGLILEVSVQSAMSIDKTKRKFLKPYMEYGFRRSHPSFLDPLNVTRPSLVFPFRQPEQDSYVPSFRTKQQ